MRASLALALVLCCIGCDRRHAVGVEIRAAGTPEATSYTLALFEGSVCPELATVAHGGGSPVAEVSFLAGDPMAFGEVRGSGPHVLVALGRDASCQPVSSSCQPFVLGEDTTVVATLSDTVWAGGAPCGNARSCQASLCSDDGALDAGMDGGVDGGPDGTPDADVDAAVDAGVDAGLDAGPRCTMVADCGHPSLVDCDDGQCVLIEPGASTTLDNVFVGPVTLLPVLHLDSTRDGAVQVHIGLLQARAGGVGATIMSLPRATVTDRTTAVRTDLPPLDGDGSAFSMSIRADAADLHWSVAGETTPLSAVAAWVGTMATPGTITDSALSGPGMQTGLGPQVTLGGGGIPIRHTTVVRTESSGALDVGSIPPFPAPADHRPWGLDPAPGGGTEYGAGDGNLVVMEVHETDEIAVWRPDPGDPHQSFDTQPAGSTGPLALAHLGGARYLMAHPVGNAVRLAATDCPATCSFDEETRVVSNGTLTTLALESTPGGGALLIEALERADASVLTARPVGAAPASVGAPRELHRTAASERITAVAALRLDDGAGHLLILAAYIQDRAAPDGGEGRLAVIRVELSRPS